MRGRTLALAGVLGAGSCTAARERAPAEPAATDAAHGPHPTPARSRLRAPAEGFVELARIEGIRLEIRYHSADNFTGAPLPGYGAPGAWLLESAAHALANVQADLAREGLGLLVYDAYRPRRATQAMVAWAQRHDRLDLLDDGYVARTSGHNLGNTLDLTLVRLDSGEPLQMGTAWDTFSPASHPANATGEARVNRRRLAAAMAARGFQPYAAEWWHFRLPISPSPRARDVPYGCFEPDEGAWQPPAGWTDPGWRAPASWPSPARAACE